MIQLFKELDFSNEIEESKDLRVFILEACKKIQQEESDILRKLKKPELDDELANQFIIAGIPLLNPEKEEKFLTLFKTKLLETKKIGQKNGLVEVLIGKDKEVYNQTLYITYKTKEEAKTAFRKLNNFKFDKNHTLQCFSINEVRDFLEEEAEGGNNKKMEQPIFATSEEKINFNLDQNTRDQFLVRQANMIYLNWCDHLDKSAQNALQKEYLNSESTINKAVMSPLGGYLALCCAEGVRIYAGHNLRYTGILEHHHAVDAKFSPDQRYIITSNGDLNKSRQNFVLWSLQEEIKLKGYKSHPGQSLDNFQFSTYDGRLAIVQPHEVVIFDVRYLEELQKQIKASDEEQHILKAPHVQKVAWLPQNWLTVMCYELDYSSPIPATRIFLYNSQTKQQRKWRAWSEHAKQGEIFISQKGQWVAIAMKKFLKKNHFATSIQIGNLLKRQQEALEVSSIEVRDEVGNIYFDDRNNRFAVIKEDETTKRGINVRYVVTFYELSIKGKSLEINTIGQIKDNLQNRVALASSGMFFALYNITQESPQKGKFSFGTITREVKEKGKRTYNFEFTKQNLMINGMSFFHLDPSGRFVLCGTDKGYQIWNYIGQIITKDTLQKTVFDVQWRPRRLQYLPLPEEKKLLEHEKDIRKKYEELDKERIADLLDKNNAIKRQRKEEFLSFITDKNKWFKGFADVRSKLLGFKEFQARTQKYQVEEGFIDLQ